MEDYQVSKCGDEEDSIKEPGYRENANSWLRVEGDEYSALKSTLGNDCRNRAPTSRSKMSQTEFGIEVS